MQVKCNVRTARQCNEKSTQQAITDSLHCQYDDRKRTGLALNLNLGCFSGFSNIVKTMIEKERGIGFTADPRILFRM